MKGMETDERLSGNVDGGADFQFTAPSRLNRISQYYPNKTLGLPPET